MGRGRRSNQAMDQSDDQPLLAPEGTRKPSKEPRAGCICRVALVLISVSILVLALLLYLGSMCFSADGTLGDGRPNPGLGTCSHVSPLAAPLVKPFLAWEAGAKERMEKAKLATLIWVGDLFGVHGIDSLKHPKETGPSGPDYTLHPTIVDADTYKPLPAQQQQAVVDQGSTQVPPVVKVPAVPAQAQPGQVQPAQGKPGQAGPGAAVAATGKPVVPPKTTGPAAMVPTQQPKAVPAGKKAAPGGKKTVGGKQSAGKVVAKGAPSKTSGKSRGGKGTPAAKAAPAKGKKAPAVAAAAGAAAAAAAAATTGVSAADAALFAKALNVKAPKAPPAGSDKGFKIAFLFLTPGPLPLAALWSRFFLNQDGRYSIYVHTAEGYAFDSQPGLPSVFKGRQIPSKDVSAGGISEVDAMRRLVANALLDANNTHFVLLSESTIPLFNFNFVAAYLTRVTLSFVDMIPDKAAWANTLLPVVPASDLRIGSPLFAVTREIATIIVKDTAYYGQFQKAKLANGVSSHYLASMLGKLAPKKIEGRTLTYGEVEAATGAVKAYHKQDVSPSLLSSLKGVKSCDWNGKPNFVCFAFARQFAADTLQPLAALGNSLGY